MFLMPEYISFRHHSYSHEKFLLVNRLLGGFKSTKALLEGIQQQIMIQIIIDNMCFSCIL